MDITYQKVGGFMLVAMYQFCLWVVVVTIGTLLYCALKTLWERKARSRV